MNVLVVLMHHICNERIGFHYATFLYSNKLRQKHILQYTLLINLSLIPSFFRETSCILLKHKTWLMSSSHFRSVLTKTNSLHVKWSEIYFWIVDDICHMKMETMIKQKIHNFTVWINWTTKRKLKIEWFRLYFPIIDSNLIK